LATGDLTISIADTLDFYLWGAQVEESSTVGEYVKTTSTKNGAPRFDHDPATGESLGLLVEESRANLQTYSVPSDAWSTYTQYGGTAPSVTYNNDTAPDGTLTAAKVVTSGTTGSQVSVVVAPSVVLTAAAHTGSVYLKGAVGGEVVPIIIEDNSTFTVQTCTLTTSWQRFPVTGTRSATNNYFVFGGWGTQTGDTSACTYYIWGAQIEADSFPTSYIPTTTAAVTRAADVASISGTNFSSWYRQDEGTVFSDSLLALGNTASYAPGIISINNGTNQNEMLQFYSGNTQINTYVKAANVTVANVAGVPFASGLRAKAASRFKTNSVNGAVNGALGTEDTSVTIPTVTTLKIGQQVTSATLNGTISRITYWPTRLPNDTLQTITT